jgi:DNA-binding NtrC family response regulator
MQSVCPGIETVQHWALPERSVRLLAAGPEDEDMFRLRNICAAAGWTLVETHSLKEARASLKVQPVPVILCGHHLPDGSWTELLDFASDLPNPPLLILWSRQADCYLWAGVLNLGGFDVLAAPFQVKEVVDAVNLALLSWLHGRAGVAVGEELQRAGQPGD